MEKTHEEVSLGVLSRKTVTNLNQLIIKISATKYEGYEDDIIRLDDIKTQIKQNVTVSPEEVITTIREVMEHMKSVETASILHRSTVLNSQALKKGLR